MLKLSKKIEYSLIALKSIKDSMDGELLSAKEISEQNNLSYDLLAKVLQNLVRKKILISTQGTKGGYTFAKNPSEVSVFSIISIFENNIGITNCLKNDEPFCYNSENCCIKNPMTKVQNDIYRYFKSVTINQL
ncbi:MAG: Rrf2 family transcriptional regulator [Ignavibacteriaceae bacterium]|nr:Rrf2 family transcriptional regulator [Ignavibacteriaceae bacterium]